MPWQMLERSENILKHFLPKDDILFTQKRADSCYVAQTICLVILSGLFESHFLYLKCICYTIRDDRTLILRTEILAFYRLAMILSPL